VPGSFVAQQIRVVLLRGVYRDQLPARVNRVDSAMSVTYPLHPQPLSNWCGAAKRRDVSGAEPGEGYSGQCA
jgi:hypothetical protein